MKFRKALSIFMAVSMLAGMVSVNVMAAENEEKENTAEETTLTMWSWTPITRTCEKMLEAFEEENPGINIEFSYYNYDPSIYPRFLLPRHLTIFRILLDFSPDL